MTFIAPVAEQKFVLEQLVRLGELDNFDDVLDPVLDGVARLAMEQWAPLSRIGDTIGARWTPEGVRMPDGFAAAYRAYAEGGWSALAVDERFGGQGLPFVLQVAALESLGAANVAFALCPTLSSGAIDALARHGSPEQHDRYLRRLATGEWTATMNLTEPQAGSDVGALRTKAEPREDGTWAISGTKIFISFGDHDMADNIVHLVLARTPGAPAGTRGISLFLVPKYRLDPDGDPGEFNNVRVLSIERKMGLHASPTCVLSYGEGGETIGELIGREGGGMAAMFTMMNNARLLVALNGVQVAEAATQKAVRYALDRVQSARAGGAHKGSVRIADHPDVRRMLLRMKAQTQAARALVYYTAGLADRAKAGDEQADARLQLLTPLAKAHATDIGCEVASLGIQVHGGTGYVEETGAAQLFRDIRIAPIYEGTNGIQAADLVMRKLDLEGGEVLARLLREIRAEADSAILAECVDACDRVARHMRSASVDNKLAGSSPFLTILAATTCGWLMERQMRAVADDAFGDAKRQTTAFYLHWLLPEVLGLSSGAMGSADLLYALDAEALLV